MTPPAADVTPQSSRHGGNGHRGQCNSVPGWREINILSRRQEGARMPRDLPIGNGKLLVTFDGHFRIRDIYYPHVGSENQTAGHINRIGVWVDGEFAWLDNQAWERSLRY